MPHDLLTRLSAAGQHRLAARCAALPDAARDELARQVAEFNLAQLTAATRNGAATDWAPLVERAAPPRAIRLRDDHPPHSRAAARARGEAALRAGQVAAVLVAGGQGTRLGFHHPKGMFPLGPVSGRTLFEMHVDQVRAISARYGAPLPLLLMTSDATHEETLRYFAEHDRLGLPPGQPRAFRQGMLPAVDAASGELLLTAGGRLALSPDGHGGMLPALASAGLLDELQQAGVELLFYWQVDSPLTRVADPELIGYHLLTGSEMSMQAVPKTDPHEKVGNIVEVDGRTRIIEYIHLDHFPQAAERRAADGSLRLWAGNSAVHVFNLSFLRRMAQRDDALPLHKSRKRVPYLDDTGRVVHPTTENAYKLERFIFDLLPHAQRTVTVEVDRAEQFAPVKNADGHPQATPASARAALVALHARWLRAAGVEVPTGIDVEIHPQFALDAEELAGRVTPGARVTAPTYFR